jgi:proteasome lid subunit RPN8/RPN11
LNIRAGTIDAVLAHARAARPAECCGMLLGRDDLIEDARPARNLSDRPSARFLIDPRDHFDALREGRCRGLEVVGFYHSHPHSRAEPSDTDRAEAHDATLHLIVGFDRDPPEIRLFRFVRGNFLAVAFVTVG